jgi:hypothetical protein
MDEFDRATDAAGNALQALAAGPGRAAAEALALAFADAGRQIENTLQQAARSGELDFERMANAVLRDIARVAAETAFNARNDGSAGSPMNFNFQLGSGADERSLRAGAGSLAVMLARIVQRGGRYL